VRGADGNEHARFSNFEAAETVDDCDAVDGIFFMELLANFAHLGERHRFVGFVIEVESGSIVRLIADKAVEGNDGTVCRPAHMLDQGGWLNGFADQLEKVVVERRGHRGTLAPAHGR